MVPFADRILSTIARLAPDSSPIPTWTIAVELCASPDASPGDGLRLAGALLQLGNAKAVELSTVPAEGTQESFRAGGHTFDVRIDRRFVRVSMAGVGDVYFEWPTHDWEVSTVALTSEGRSRANHSDCAKPKRERGRPLGSGDTDPERDAGIFAMRKSGQYPTNRELADALGDGETAKGVERALDRVRKRKKRSKAPRAARRK